MSWALARSNAGEKSVDVLYVVDLRFGMIFVSLLLFREAPGSTEMETLLH